MIAFPLVVAIVQNSQWSAPQGGLNPLGGLLFLGMLATSSAILSGIITNLTIIKKQKTITQEKSTLLAESVLYRTILGAIAPFIAISVMETYIGHKEKQFYRCETKNDCVAFGEEQRPDGTYKGHCATQKYLDENNNPKAVENTRCACEINRCRYITKQYYEDQDNNYNGQINPEDLLWSESQYEYSTWLRQNFQSTIQEQNLQQMKLGLTNASETQIALQEWIVENPNSTRIEQLQKGRDLGLNNMTDAQIKDSAAIYQALLGLANSETKRDLFQEHIEANS